MYMTIKVDQINNIEILELFDIVAKFELFKTNY